jgi:hypothetical protein
MRTKTPTTQFQRSPATLANSGTSAVKSARPIDASLRGHAARFYRQAAERWREFGNVLERAYALLGQGRRLAALGDPEAEVPLREAREFLESMGYKSALAETETLLGESEVADV